ncbi:MAG: cadherin repeat domain-containing protein, partial [Candidatus Pacebacteria bacterium]|nr:cadherin repeat domain-containing protein [Candidatus Paceibacterota bacterium]
INANISSFPSVANSIFVKTFMTGDGTQEVEVDEIIITYETNSIPTDIFIDGISTDNVDENTAIGTQLAALTTTDLDVVDTHTYSLVSGIGDEDNSNFTISGANLNLDFIPDFENPTDLGDTAGNNTYSIRIQTDDGNGGVFQKEFIVNINDVSENFGKSGKIRSAKSGKKVCKDSKATNFNNVGQHDQSLCIYKEEENKTEEVATNIEEVKLGEGVKCPASQSLTQNLKAGDRNGRFST